MPLNSSYSVDTKRGICTVRIHGLATATGLAEAFFAAFSDPEWDRDFNLIIVYEADALLGNLTLEDLRNLQRQLNDRQAQVGIQRKMKSALVYRRAEQRTLLDLHVLSYRDQDFLEERVFATEAEALQWLTTPPAVAVE